jgi:hypothetical protein
VSHFLDGYRCALHDVRDDSTDDPFDGWMEWVGLRFLIRSSAWGWPRILVHAYGSDRSAIEALPSLYKQFCEARAALGVEGIQCDLEKQFIERFGQDWHEPETTATKPVSYTSD